MPSTTDPAAADLAAFDDQLQGGAAPAVPAAQGSILAQLRSEYDKSMAERTIILALPWLDGLWGKFTPIDVPDYEEARKRRVETMDDNLLMTADSIARHCVEILYGDSRETAEPLQAVVERETGKTLSGPIRFDENLALMFGIEDPTGAPLRPRAIVLGLLTRPTDKLPFTAFAEKLVLWSRGEAGKAVEDAVGE